MIEVVAPGLQTTVQDLGREGFGPLGVSPSGAADPLSLRIANRLVGNAESAAALEMTLLGGSFRFEQDAGIALAGSDFGGTLEGEAIPLWTSHWVRAGQTLRCGPTRSGARCYLTISGGIEVPLFLGSASTHLLSGLGGFEGRALKKGDRLRIGRTEAVFRPRHVKPEDLARLASRKTLRVTRGPQWDWFSDAAHAALLESGYEISEESNRMGLRLKGAALASTAPGHMLTEGVPLGAIQIPPGGQPIILFVEQQTTGGYPKVANVISADLASVGQLRPRDRIRFELVTPAEARELIVEQHARLYHIIVADDETTRL